jgi:hypothetical protein
MMSCFDIDFLDFAAARRGRERRIISAPLEKTQAGR